MSSRPALSLLLFGLLLALAPAGEASAQGGADLGEASVTVPAKGEASIPFRTYCLETGKVFPTSLGRLQGRAPESARKVLKVAIERGLAATDPLQTQMAIWHEVNGEWPYGENVARAEAESLVTAAASASLAPLEPEGVALDRAIRDGTVTVTSTDFRALDAPAAEPGEPPYVGSGTLTVRNETARDVTVYYPFGLLIESPAEGQQDVISYATERKDPTRTPAPTAAATATGRAVPAALPRTGAGPAESKGPSAPVVLVAVAAAALSVAVGLGRRRRRGVRAR